MVKVIIGWRKTWMTKIAAQRTGHCAALVLRTPPLLFPSFLISCDTTQSLLLDLCLWNPLSLLLIGVECNSFCSSVHLQHYATNHISLYFFLWRITPDYRCLVDGSVDLGSVVALFFQHFSCPGSFLFLPSPLILMFVICGWLSCQFSSIFVIPPLSLCQKDFVDWCVNFFQSTHLDTLTFPLFLCTLRVLPSGSMGACSWSLNKCDSCCCQVFSRENIQLAQRQCLWILLPSKW
jgi:hypothetical protein